MKLLPLSLIPLLLLLSVSCSRGSSVSSEVEDIARSDITLYESSFTLGQEGQNPLYIKSASLALDLDENKASAEGISFYQKSDDGEVFIKGHADKADINTETKVVEMRGNAYIEQLEDELAIYADELTFDSEAQKVESLYYVSISFDGGKISGRNLSADLNASTLELKEIEQGVLNP